MEALRIDAREAVGRLMSSMPDSELTRHLGRGRYERLGGSCKLAQRQVRRQVDAERDGEVKLEVPRDRGGTCQTRMIPKWRRYEKALVDDLSLMFLSGCSTGSLSLISKRLIGRSISPTETSDATRELSVAVEQRRQRDLSQAPVKYLYLDGINFNMRLSGGITKVPVLVIPPEIENVLKIIKT